MIYQIYNKICKYFYPDKFCFRCLKTLNAYQDYLYNDCVVCFDCYMWVNRSFDPVMHNAMTTKQYLTFY